MNRKSRTRTDQDNCLITEFHEKKSCKIALKESGKKKCIIIECRALAEDADVDNGTEAKI
jgi:hypothetical protein